jgi:hypothetical protein
MLAAVNEMEQTHKLTEYLLDLYLPYGLLPEPSFRCGQCCAKYHAQSFYGTQCMQRNLQDRGFGKENAQKIVSWS